MKKLLLFLFLLQACTPENESQMEWSRVVITRIHPAFKGSRMMEVVWEDDRGVEHCELTDTTGLGYTVGLTKTTLIKR